MSNHLPKSHELLVHVNRAGRAFSELLATCLSHHHLTVPQWTLLGRLYDQTAARPIDIAKFLGVKPPFVTKILAELEAQGYITYAPFPDDERGKIVRLTAAGATMVEHVEPMLQDCLKSQFQPVNTQDLATYFLLNQFIADHVHHR